MNDLGCTICLRKFPGKKYWQLAKIKFEVFGSGIEAQVCPECQKRISDAHGFGCAWKVLEGHWKKARAELRELAGFQDKGPEIG